MKNAIYLLVMLSLLFATACGGGGKSRIEQIKEQSAIVPADPYDSWETNKGIGPIKSVSLSPDVDQSLASKGQEIYESKCTACHKPDKRFIGPAPKDILSRRTPEWTLNMILNPDEMTQKDPIAKKLLMEFNGSPMANQNLTEEEARAVLEYFRTL